MLTPLQGLIDKYAMQISGVLHVGAHTGEEAEAYRDAGIRDVLWVEANPELIPTLSAHVVPLGHKVVNACASDRDGTFVNLNVTNNVMSSSVLELGTHAIKAPQVVYTHTVESPERTIDSLCDMESFHGFNVLNMDIQGYEMHALKGATRALQHIDWIFTEINLDELYVGCARVWELDKFLWETARLFRIETWYAGATVGWGDALYAREAAQHS